MFDETTIPNLGDVVEYHPVEEGEYKLRITKVEQTVSKSTDRRGAWLTLVVLGEDEADYIRHGIWFPMEGDDQRKSNNMLRSIKELALACQLPAEGGFSLGAFQDCEFTGLLGIEEMEDKDGNKTGRFRNVLKRAILD